MLKGRQKDECDNSYDDLEKLTRKSEVVSNYKLATRSIDQHVSVYFITLTETHFDFSFKKLFMLLK